MNRHGQDMRDPLAATPADARMRVRVKDREARPDSRPARLHLPFPLSRQMKALLLVLLASWAGDALAGTPPETRIENTARVGFTAGGATVDLSTNEVALETTLAEFTPAAIGLLRYGNDAPGATPADIGGTQCEMGGAFGALPAPLSMPGVGELGAALPVVSADTYHGGEPVFVRIEDGDHNLDSSVRERVVIELRVDATNDRERLSLLETGRDTGVFIGAVQTVRQPVEQYDCVLAVATQSRITASYEDYFHVETVASVLVDPFGILFDAVTGAPVDGAVVRFINVDTGQPAEVFGDDGVSEYPAELVSGGEATDASGASYDFPPGEYRFPYARPGNYRLEVVPPPGYAWPSETSTADIDTLPNAPYAIVNGSRGENFVINPGPALHVDIPLDPVASSLFVRKSASTAIASIGDFVQYRLEMENIADQPARNPVMIDILPHGMRYVAGSMRLDGVAGGDPVIGDDGRTLEFPLDDLSAGQTVALAYVVEIAAGAKPGPARNSVTARADGGASANTAEAVVEIRSELFDRASTLVGEILDGGCAADDGEAGEGADTVNGVAGVRVFLEDGSYAISDTRGRFHFKGVRPGVHVVQLDRASIPPGWEVAACQDNNRFAGSSTSQFVDLQAGTLWRVDFHLRRQPAPKGSLSLALDASPARAGAADVGVQLGGRDVAIDKLRLTILLPEGGSYIPGSATLDGTALADPELGEGVVTFRLGDRPAEWQQRLAFEIGIARDREQHELHALASFDTASSRNQRTPAASVQLIVPQRAAPAIVVRLQFASYSAALSAVDRRELERVAEFIASRHVDGGSDIALRIVGHTDNQPIEAVDGPFADNQALSLARARTVAERLGELLDLAPEKILFEGRGASEPLADNATAVGRARNRRVEIFLVDQARPQATTEKDANAVSVVTRGELPGGKVTISPPSPVAETAANYAPYAKPVDGAFLATLDPGATRMLWPPVDANPPIDAVKIAIQHPPGTTVSLDVNGKPVPATSLGGIYTGKGVLVTEHMGVGVVEGDNRIVARISDGTVLERVVHYSGPAVRGELVPELSNLVANGRDNPVIAIRLFDRWGKPVRARMLGRYQVAAPYQPFTSVEELQERQLFATGRREQNWLVGEDGVTYIELAPTTVSGEALVTLDFEAGRKQEFRAWLSPEARDWVLVGLAEGTVGYNTVDGNTETLRDAGGEEDYYQEGRVAFYAKGRIKGEYLLTLSYDTRNSATVDGDRLEQSINPDEYYLVYGDATQQRHDAASIRNLYVRIERQQFYALFGDYDTGLSETDLSRYTRRMNGLKSEYRGEIVSYAAFASENAQAFVKDEIQGDGTSGLYRLSRAPLLINSESVRLETRDRYRNEIIVSRQPLTRNLDYTIDYFNGTLFFKRPVPSHDQAFNPVFIVAEYEVEHGGEDDVTGGGRVAWQVAENVEIGVTAIHEGAGTAGGELAGADIKVALGDATELKAEIATSDAVAGGIDREGNGYAVELRHQGETLGGRVYARETDAGFGLGQQSIGELGTRKQGAEGTYRFSEQLEAVGTAWHQENLDTQASREVLETALRYNDTERNATVGVRHAADALASGDEKVSDQVFAGGSMKLTERIGVHARAETGIGEQSGSAAFPDRVLLGAEYALATHATLFAEQEFVHGPSIDGEMTRVGVRAEPWDRARFNSAIEQRYGEYGPRTFATVGLAQGWQATENLLFDIGLDRVQSLREPDYVPLDPATPEPYAATEDFTAAYLGATWNDESWTWTGRVERRISDSERRWGAFAGAFRQYGEALGLSLSLFHTDAERIAARETHSNLRFGLAWRPTQSQWIVLNRSDVIFDDRYDSLQDSQTWKFVNNLNANWQAKDDLQISLQHGFKYTRAQFDDAYTGITELYGIEARQDIDAYWDIGAHTATLRSRRAGTGDDSFGVSVGRRLFENVRVAVGYNFDGFHDADFTAAGYTARGLYLRFMLKFDQDTVRELRKRFGARDDRQEASP